MVRPKVGRTFGIWLYAAKIATHGLQTGKDCRIPFYGTNLSSVSVHVLASRERADGPLGMICPASRQTQQGPFLGLVVEGSRGRLGIGILDHTLG